MELRRWIEVLCIVSALQDFLDFRVYSLHCPNSYYSTDHGGKERCCLKCEAGERVERHCLVGQNDTTKCKACETGTYQEAPNGEMSCRKCAKQEKQYRKLLTPCTKLTNMEYGDCYEGYYHDILLDTCKECKKCAKGYGVIRECNKDSNTLCDEEKCGMGTYSDEESLTQKCTKCTACINGEEMYKECTPYGNYECRPKITATPTETTSKSTIFHITAMTTPKPPLPTHASREKDQSWVMPFFIAAMVIVLILSLALIIGVTIWCHIQSKNRQHNVIVQAEDPQLVQRLTKLMEEEESVCSM
ncbi:tumor necrosis factor receptor superfamily member 16-like isoform X2 [Dendronephthya gigantea]|nr:tumor necrosis factor receptor superfamily member 16-like isoform X2 [Dendronephthya gigantea]XP_028393666.1 tumor necrosis factor receptor superfamily member 16-like isoform X2 [Dendronephthya gigantea]